MPRYCTVSGAPSIVTAMRSPSMTSVTVACDQFRYAGQRGVLQRQRWRDVDRRLTDDQRQIVTCTRRQKRDTARASADRTRVERDDVLGGPRRV